LEEEQVRKTFLRFENRSYHTIPPHHPPAWFRQKWVWGKFHQHDFDILARSRATTVHALRVDLDAAFKSITRVFCGSGSSICRRSQNLVKLRLVRGYRAH
jgi:hypothetical protein